MKLKCLETTCRTSHLTFKVGDVYDVGYQHPDELGPVSKQKLNPYDDVFVHLGGGNYYKLKKYETYYSTTFHIIPSGVDGYAIFKSLEDIRDKKIDDILGS